MKENKLNTFYIEVNLYKDKRFNPIVLLTLVSHSNWTLGQGYKYIDNFKKSELLKEINKTTKLSRDTLSKNLKYLEEVDKIYYLDNKVCINDASLEDGCCIINKEQKDKIVRLNTSTEQRLALLHINNVNMFNKGYYRKPLETICSELGISTVNRDRIISMNKTLAERGIIRYSLVKHETSYINQYSIY